jgi:hypothetical protein
VFIVIEPKKEKVTGVNLHNAYKVLVGQLEGKNHLKYLHIDESIILK